MRCPYCGMSLTWIDYYGVHTGTECRDKIGDIFECDNKECDAYHEYFYTDKEGNLREGYPC